MMEVILAIDLGSTSARAFLYCANERFGCFVEPCSPGDSDSQRYQRGDFCASGHPFDNQQSVYSQGPPNPNRRTTAVKFFFYALEDLPDHQLKDYPLIAELLAMKHDLGFRGRLLQGLHELFSHIKQRIDSVCDQQGLVVEKIGLSIPAQWTLDFEETYRNIVSDVFHHPPGRIFFHTETVALAHYLIKDFSRVLGFSHQEDVVLFLDFGGHSMNGCIFSINKQEGGKPKSFHLIDDPFGVGGGSEQWEHSIGEACSRIYMRCHGKVLSTSQHQGLLDNFFDKKKKLGAEMDAHMLLYSFTESRANTMLCIPVEVLRKAFDDALQEPLRVAEEYIAKISALENVNARVVVSGGTSRNKTLKQRLHQMCEKQGLAAPIWTNCLELAFESGKIAKGTAYATANMLTPSEFLDRGAAFGLQRLDCAMNGKSKENKVWSEKVDFLLDKSRHVEQILSVTGRDRVRITCDPFCCASSGTSQLQVRRCYNFLELGKFTRGSWKIKLSTMPGQGGLMLLLETWMRPWNGSESQELRPYRREEISLYFDGGTNCLHVAGHDGTLEGLFQRPRGREEEPQPRAASPVRPADHVQALLPEEPRNVKTKGEEY